MTTTEHHENGTAPEGAAAPEVPPPPVEVPHDDLTVARGLLAERAPLARKLAFVSATVARLPKTRQAPPQSGGYWFTPVEDMAAAITRLLGAVGVAMLPETVETLAAGRDVQPQNDDPRRHYFLLRITWHITDGNESLRIQSTGEAADWGDKGSNKAQTAARKYAYVTAFHLQMGDDDTDRHAPGDGGEARPARSGGGGRKTPDAEVQRRKEAVLAAHGGDEAAALTWLKRHDCGSFNALRYPKVWGDVEAALQDHQGPATGDGPQAAPSPRQTPSSSPGGGQKGRGPDVGPEGVEARWQAVLNVTGSEDAAKEALRSKGVRAKSGLGYDSFWREVADALGIDQNVPAA